jgi:cell division protein FtsB
LRPILLALALVAAAAGYAWLFADDGVPTWRSLDAEVVQARERERGLEAGNAALRAEIDSLRTDAFAQERAVREVLHWVRPGEVVVRVPHEEADGDLPGAGGIP